MARQLGLMAVMDPDTTADMEGASHLRRRRHLALLPGAEALRPMATTMAPLAASFFSGGVAWSPTAGKVGSDI